MKKADLEFINGLFLSIGRAKQVFGTRFGFTLEETTKGNWALQLSFESTNAKFSDIVLIYPDRGNDTDEVTGNDEILCAVDGIIEKAINLLK